MASSIVRADNFPLPSWQFQDVDESGAPRFEEDGVTPILMDLTGSAFILTVSGPGLRLALTTADDELDVDLETNTLSWPITLAQAAKFPLGKAVTYTIQRIIDGKYQTLTLDSFTGASGPNGGGHATVLLTGPIGPTGDVTPEATAAKEAAEAAAASVTASASTIARLDSDGRDRRNPKPAAPYSINSDGTSRTDVIQDGVEEGRVLFAGSREIGSDDTASDLSRRALRYRFEGGYSLLSGKAALHSNDAPVVYECGDDVIFSTEQGGLLFGLLPDEAAVLVAAKSDVIPAVEAALWCRPGGAVQVVLPDADYDGGAIRYLATPKPEPTTSLGLKFYFTDMPEGDRPAQPIPGSDVDIWAVRQFQGIPAVAYVPRPAEPGTGRAFGAFYGSVDDDTENARNFVILKYCDRNGDVDPYPQANWREYGYLVHLDDTYRTLDPSLHYCRQVDTLFLFCATANDDHDGRYGVWVTPIKEPLGGEPVVYPSKRLMTFGIPMTPIEWRGRIIMPVDLVEDPAGPLFDIAGTRICEFDPVAEELVTIGMLPPSPANWDWQETSIVALPDGTLAAAIRTGDATLSAYISYSEDGQTWSDWTKWSSLGEANSSRGKFIKLSSGRVGFVWNKNDGNNAASRVDMAVAVWDRWTALTDAPDYEEIISDAAYLCSYPDTVADDDGHQIIVADHERDGDRTIWGVEIAEASILAGTADADKKFFKIDEPV